MRGLLLLPFVIACTTSSSASSDKPDLPPAKFATASPAQLGGVLDAASGTDAVIMSVFQGAGYFGGNTTTGCPTVVTSGNTTTATGGCTDSSGTMWSGTVTATNVPPSSDVPNPAYNAAQPTHVAFDMFTQSSTSDTLVVDGTVDLTKLVVSASESTITIQFSALDSALSVTAKNVTATNHLHLVQTTASTVGTSSKPSWIEIDGLGSATLTSSVDTTTGAGMVTVHGTDDLVFDLATRDSNDCVQYTLGATHGTACPLD